MARLVQPFNPLNFNPILGGGNLPIGRHPVVIEDSEIKPTADNSGGMLVLSLMIIDGEHKGESGVYRLNLYHSNPKAEEFANRQFSAVCHVCGHLSPVQDSAELHNIPFVIDVQLQNSDEAKEKGYTEVKRVFDINGNEPGKGANQPQGGTPAQGGGWNPNQQTTQPAQGAQGGAWNQPQGGTPAQGQWAQPGTAQGAPDSGKKIAPWAKKQ